MRSLGPLILCACAPDLSKDAAGDDDDAPSDDPIVEVEPGVARVDATSETEAVHWDVDAMAAVAADDPTWDLSFRRFEVRVNGGVSGDGGVEGVVLDGVAWDELVEAPADGWITDEADADADGVDELVFVAWYDYDYTNHTLSAADRVYALRTTEGATFRLGFLDYYDDAGTPAMITLRYGALPVTP